MPYNDYRPTLVRKCLSISYAQLLAYAVHCYIEKEQDIIGFLVMITKRG
jgi:hypothetical protein